MSKTVKLAVVRMAEDFQTGGYCDVFKWFTFMARDVVGEAFFGESFHKHLLTRTFSFRQSLMVCDFY